MIFKIEQNKGFTLIELLVVIDIIGLLSSVVLASLNSARVRANDAKRLSDIHQISNALQLYASDNNGLYPPGTYDSRTPSDWTTFSNYLVKYFPNGVPVDPKNASAEGDMLPQCGNCGMYYYYANGTGFVLYARVAVNSNGNASDQYSHYFQIAQN